MEEVSLTGSELIAVLSQQGISESDPRISGAFAFLNEKGEDSLSKEELSDVTKKVFVGNVCTHNIPVLSPSL